MPRADTRPTFALLPLLALACGADRAQSAPAAASAPFDVAAVMTRAHYAFRAERSALSGGHFTYGVQVAADGAAVVTPHATASSAGTGAPARIETAAITRGGTALPGDTGAPSLSRDGTVVIARGEVVERLQNTAAGVEQSWTFPARPEGAGDVTVRVRLTGLAPTGATGLGLHFSDPATGLGLRYGAASWIDGLGQVSPVATHLDGDEIVITVPEELLQQSVFPAVLDPVIGPEFGMDVPVSTHAWNARENPAIAYDGTRYLAAWLDHRYAGFAYVYAARVARDGTVLDPVGIPVSKTTDASTGPKVAFGGTSYMVVWGATGIHAARLSTAGAVLDATDIVVSASGSSPSIAFDGTNHLVVWADAGVKGARLSTAGVLLEPSAIAISGPSASIPAVAFGGSSYLVTWSDSRRPGDPFPYRDIYGARVATTGTVLDPAGVAISTAASPSQPLADPAVASDGTNYAVAWSVAFGAGVRAARVAGNGAVLDPSGISISPGAGSTPALAFDGTSYLIAWAAGGIRGARLRPDGTIVDPAGIAISSALDSQSAPALASDGAGWIAAWKSDGLTSDILGARVGDDGAVLDARGILVSTSANAQFSRAVAHDGTNYLVVWQDFRGTHYEIHAVRVAKDGTVLDPNGISVSSSSGDTYAPQVAFAGGRYLVVWSDQRRDPSDIYGARIATDGTVLDQLGIPISTAPGVQTGPYVASDGATFLVLWDDESGSFGTYGARVAADGTVLDPSGIAVSARRYVSGLAFDGTNYLALWAADGIYGARLRSDGSPLDPAAVQISASGNSSAALAFDGTNFLVVWQDLRSGTSYDIYGARVGKDGAVMDRNGIPISTAAGNQLTPAVAFDGTSYLVAWQDYRSGAGIQIYGRQVSRAGVPLDSADVPLVMETTLNNLAPALASTGQGSTLLVYDRFDPSPPYGSYRLRGRIVTTPATPPVAPVLTKVSPPAGPVAGGVRVVLTGSNFQRGAIVTFGGATASSTTLGGSTIVARTPRHQGGTVDVTVRNPDGGSGTLAGAYTYVPVPRLAGVSSTLIQ